MGFIGDQPLRLAGEKSCGLKHTGDVRSVGATPDGVDRQGDGRIEGAQDDAAWQLFLE
jgi:hypothetical protein